MDSLYSQSPRGLAYNVILAKWSELCASLIPKLLSVGIQFDGRETSIGCKSYTYGDNDTAHIGWATSFGDTSDIVKILISYKSGDGEMFSSHTLPVINGGTEISPERKDYFADQHTGCNPTIESIYGLKGFITVINQAETITVEEIGESTTIVVGVET